MFPPSKILICFLLMSLSSVSPGQKISPLTFNWKEIAVLPSKDGAHSIGVAGAIHGVSHHVLIIAGGANFPKGMPWDGGKKFYSDEIHVLQHEDSHNTWNHKVTGTLPEPVAYCGSTSTEAGVVYAGGENEKGISNKCYLLDWNGTKNCIHIKPLPDLPLALTNVAVSHIGSIVYAAGGDQATSASDKFFSLDLNHPNQPWKKLPDLPIALANATAIAQSAKEGKEIFIIGGRTKSTSGISVLHHTTFAFDPLEQSWRKCADISNGSETTNLSAASGIALGKNEILITGGDNGKVFHEIEKYNLRIMHAASVGEKAKLTEERNALNIHHKGFDPTLFLYNTIKDQWTKIGELPFPAHVTTTDVKWGNTIVVSNGEIKPGVRTPVVMAGEIIEIKSK